MRTLRLLLPAALGVTSCRAPAYGGPPASASAPARPAAPAAQGAAATPGEPDTARRGYTLADARFMQGMIAHHAQALVMVGLLPTRTSRSDMRSLGERIAVSQQDEIAAMSRWLRDRHEDVPDAASVEHMAAGHEATMPGMLTSAELQQLRQSHGTEFERLFLAFMIRHHQGALTMVARLFQTSGSGREPQLYQFAADVDADQRAEIARMQSLLGTLPDSTIQRSPQ